MVCHWQVRQKSSNGPGRTPAMCTKVHKGNSRRFAKNYQEMWSSPWAAKELGRGGRYSVSDGRRVLMPAVRVFKTSPSSFSRFIHRLPEVIDCENRLERNSFS